MSLKVKITGVKDTINNLDRIDENTRKQLQKAISMATIKTESLAKQRAPVDTGRLRSSISSSVTELQGEVEANVDYATYMEFGTGSETDFSYINDATVRKQAQSFASQYRGKGIRNVNIPGYKYMMTSFLEGKSLLLRMIRNIL